MATSFILGSFNLPKNGCLSRWICRAHSQCNGLNVFPKFINPQSDGVVRWGLTEGG